MKTSRTLSVMGATMALTMTLGVTPASAEEAPVPAGAWCEASADCAAGEACLYGTCQEPAPCASHGDCWTDWCATDGTCGEAPSCQTDAECGADTLCDYGRCAPRGRSCLADTECGAYARCVFGDTDSAEVGSASTGSSGGGSSGGASEPASGGGSGSGSSESDAAPPREEIPGDPPTWIPRGECQVDVAAVPVDATCAALCEAAARCMVSATGQTPSSTSTETIPAPGPDDAGGADDAGSADDAADPRQGAPDQAPAYEPPAPTEEEREAYTAACTAMCSYGVATAVTTSEAIGAALSCVEAQASCDTVETACEAEVEAMAEMFDGIDAVVDLDQGFADATDHASGTAGGLETNGTPKGQDISGAPADNGACSGGAGGAPLGLTLLLGVALLAWRRRAV